MNYAEFFSQGLIGRIIPSFPYVTRHCTYCEQPCELVDAIHVQQEPEHYKALFLCQNPDCGAYDEEARCQYARVYYSSEPAFRMLETHAIHTNIKRKS